MPGASITRRPLRALMPGASIIRRPPRALMPGASIIHSAVSTLTRRMDHPVIRPAIRSPGAGA